MLIDTVQRRKERRYGTFVGCSKDLSGLGRVS
jgi:hypothetical protein